MKKKPKFVPRDREVESLIGRARTFIDRKRKQKKDKVGRKAKHKQRD